MKTPILRLLWAAITLRLLRIWWERQREWIWIGVMYDFGIYTEHVRMLRWRARRLRAKWEREERAASWRRWRRDRWRMSK